MVLTTEQTLTRRLIDTAPPLRLSEGALQQVVSWSKSGQPVTLGQFLRARAPDVASRFRLGSLSEEERESVRRIEDLPDDDLREVVKLRLRKGSDGLRLAVLGRGELTVDELEREIDAKSELGQRLTAAERSNLILLERLAEAGKIRSISDTDAPIEIPALPF